jgi:hypothetical protein
MALSTRKKRQLKREWEMEQERLKKRFAEARDLYQRIEKGEVLMSTSDTTKEEELIQQAVLAEQERKQVRLERKKDVEEAAKKEMAFRTSVAEGLNSFLEDQRAYGKELREREEKELQILAAFSGVLERISKKYQ